MKINIRNPSFYLDLNAGQSRHYEMYNPHSQFARECFFKKERSANLIMEVLYLHAYWSVNPTFFRIFVHVRVLLLLWSALQERWDSSKCHLRLQVRTKNGTDFKVFDNQFYYREILVPSVLFTFLRRSETVCASLDSILITL